MDEGGKDFKLLSTFFLLSLALSNKVSASSGKYWFSLFSFLYFVKRLRMWSDNFVAKSCDLSAFKDLNCSSKIFDWLGAKRIKIDRFAFVKALSGKLMPKQSRGFSNLRWLEPGNVYQVCITKLLFSIGWIIICLKSISFNWTPCSIINSESGTVNVNGRLCLLFEKLVVLAVTRTQKCLSSVDNGWILCQSNYILLNETYVYIFEQCQLISLVMRT